MNIKPSSSSYGSLNIQYMMLQNWMDEWMEGKDPKRSKILKVVFFY